MRWDWKAVVGIAISAILVWWVLRDVDPAEVWEAARSANWWILGAAVAVATSGFLTRALRWRLLLHPLHPETRLGTRFAAVNIGFAMNNLLPARIGEFARAWSISRLEPVSVSGAIGSLVVERFLDAVAILLLFGIAVLAPGFPADATLAGRPVGAMLIGVASAMVALCVVLLLLIAFPRAFIGAVERVSVFLPEGVHRFLRELLGSFIEGLGALRDPRLLAAGLVWSIGIWAWNGVSFWLAFQAFGIDQGYLTALFVQAVIALGVAVPSAPGYFGTFHAAAVVALGEVYAVGEAATLAFAFGYHLGGFFPVTLLGLWYASRLGLSFSELGRAEEVVESELHERFPIDRPGGEPALAVEGGEEGRSRWVGEAPAKANLFLKVHAREDSGFHQIETVFQRLTLADRIELLLRPGGAIGLEVSGVATGALGPDDQNLAVRAARALLERAQVSGESAPGVTIRIHKRVPHGAGLGGGSSDAATVLLGLNELLGKPLTPAELESLGAELGSDVPFFVSGASRAVGQGRGELLSALPGLPAREVLIAVPTEPVSTAWAYRELDEKRKRDGPIEGGPSGPHGSEEPTLGLASSDWSDVETYAANDFEEVLFPLRPELRQLKQALMEGGARLALLSGSGSAVFGVFGDEDGIAVAERLVHAAQGASVATIRARTVA